MENPAQSLSLEQTATQEAQAASEGYVKRDLIAIDQTANVFTGGLPDETISARLARASKNGSKIGKIGSAILNLFQKDHGAKAVAGDEERAANIVAAEQDSGLIK